MTTTPDEIARRVLADERKKIRISSKVQLYDGVLSQQAPSAHTRCAPHQATIESYAKGYGRGNQRAAVIPRSQLTVCTLLLRVCRHQQTLLKMTS